jgi:hypothetical protein
MVARKTPLHFHEEDKMKPTKPAAPDKSLETLLAEGVDTVRKMDPVVREELKNKPEALAEWDAIMQDYADILMEDDSEAEQAKVAAEIRQYMDQITADMQRLEQLDPTDLEVNEGIARNLAAVHEVDAIMRAKCGKYPAQLAEWEEGVMRPVRMLEMMFVEAMHIENEKPEN